MESRFVRTELLLGEAALAKLANSHVAVFGIGGLFVYAFAASGSLKTAGQKMKRSFQEMTGGLLGWHHDDKNE